MITARAAMGSARNRGTGTSEDPSGRGQVPLEPCLADQCFCMMSRHVSGLFRGWKGPRPRAGGSGGPPLRLRSHGAAPQGVERPLRWPEQKADQRGVCPPRLKKVTRSGKEAGSCARAASMPQARMTTAPANCACHVTLSLLASGSRNCGPVLVAAALLRFQCVTLGFLGEWVAGRLALAGRVRRVAALLFLVLRSLRLFLFLVASHLTLGHGIVLLMLWR